MVNNRYFGSTTYGHGPNFVLLAVVNNFPLATVFSLFGDECNLRCASANCLSEVDSGSDVTWGWLIFFPSSNQ